MLRKVQKPARYIGGENGAIYKNKADVKLRFAFCFPDTYEIGMSGQALQILYHTLNADPDVWCERAFAPWFDLRQQLLAEHQPLFALESRDPLSAFDVLGFTLQYELSFTNVLDMLALGGVPLLAAERGEDDPLVAAGGPCCCNPEPMADFFDLFLLGDGEELDNELCRVLIDCREKGLCRADTLRACAKIEGVYVPSLYEVCYRADGTVERYTPAEGAPYPVKKRLLLDLDKAAYPTHPIIPAMQVVHDRACVEVLRGCIRGCRFCQAGFLYRPFRWRSAETLCAQSREILRNTGYEELSLLSLSTSDHPQLEPLLDGLLSFTVDERVNLSLPSLRVDSFSEQLAEKIRRVRQSGLTFAPEAGTQRMRDVINKNITEENILSGCRDAFESGYSSVKLYFMMGLPTETDEDIVGIAELAQKVVDLYYSLPTKPKGRSVGVTVSVACFIPKPKTPFEVCGFDPMEELERKQRLLRQSIRSRKITLNWHDARTSYIEAVLAKGDRQLGRAILEAYRQGAVFDAWEEGFSFERWMQAFADSGLDPAFYALRQRSWDETEPWDIVDYGVSKAFLKREWERASSAQTTPNCREHCSGCGMNGFAGRECFAEH